MFYAEVSADDAQKQNRGIIILANTQKQNRGITIMANAQKQNRGITILANAPRVARTSSVGMWALTWQVSSTRQDKL